VHKNNYVFYLKLYISFINLLSGFIKSANYILKQAVLSRVFEVSLGSKLIVYSHPTVAVAAEEKASSPSPFSPYTLNGRLNEPELVCHTGEQDVPVSGVEQELPIVQVHSLFIATEV
jgi:hypothetical protein